MQARKPSPARVSLDLRTLDLRPQRLRPRKSIIIINRAQINHAPWFLTTTNIHPFSLIYHPNLPSSTWTEPRGFIPWFWHSRVYFRSWALCPPSCAARLSVTARLLSIFGLHISSHHDPASYQRANTIYFWFILAVSTQQNLLSHADSPLSLSL